MTPIRVLCRFEKVKLAPGESALVSFDVMRRDISNWDVIQQRIVSGGKIDIKVGFISRDIMLKSLLGI